ncbi:MAG: S8 family serine peptidase [Planctomycetota bacterium]|jgi:hypothetical protein
MSRSFVPDAIQFLVGVCLTIHVAAAQENAIRPDAVGGYSTRRIVIQLKPAAEQRVAADRAVANAGPAADPRPWLGPALKTASDHWRVSHMRPLHVRPFRNPALAAQLGLDRTYIMEVPAGTDTIAMSAAIAALNDDVDAAYVDAIGGVALTPNDPDFALQYAMNNTGQVAGGSADADIDAVEAWSIHTGDPGTVTIAIIDSGVDPHPEYSARMVPGQNTNDPSNPTLTTDACPHGTHVAGIAAASGNNGIGVAGVTWGASVMPVRVLDGCSGFVSDLATGIIWAADNGADVLNISLHYYDLSSAQSQNLQSAVNYAHGLGAALVAAAGNGYTGVVAYPARLANVVAVSATDQTDTFASFSNYGAQIDICAPGKDIWSTWTGGGYSFNSGTSMSAPHVSGAVALLMSYRPTLSNDLLVDVMLAATDDLGTPGWDSRYGRGRLNLFNALIQVDCVAQMTGVEPAQAELDPLTKNRAISFAPANAGRQTAIRVTLASLHHPNPPYTGGAAADFSAFEGQIRWVGPPVEYMESQSSLTPFVAATLQCTPYYTDWSTVGLLHVIGAEIVPSSVYELQSVPEGCSIAAEFDYSTTLTVVTGRWGDIESPFSPPAASQQPDIADISALVNKFKSALGAPIKSRALLAGDIPDPAPDVGFDHIAACVEAFKGLPYPYAGLPSCP